MTWEIALFIIGITLACNVGWLINNWIRAKHGYPLEDEWGGTTEKPDTAKEARLAGQNAKLMETMEKMQDRMVVLERIVTDKGYRVAEEIEALRDAPVRESSDNGVPLNLGNKENA
ncbi:hypothetical protein [Aurantiacibacter sediminis]|uniref:Phage shock protein B n=1 Tax=Aurantiacibacter sediminis TaxID=2793064 RepID=A0ABS0N5X9_9SPHN|nr:hypothetical protein [Aurantiacibacter sediminis]MBH5323214.1 hypothetical protein [Aurantiacibacter sediminis]